MATRRVGSKAVTAKKPSTSKPVKAKAVPSKSAVATSVELTRLFEAVYRHPADDARRLVLGDALLERGDPRGELIAEQQRRTAKGVTTPSRRERDLVRDHAEAWLGPVDEVLRQPGFRLGFLSVAALKGGGHDFGALADAPQWRTIERLNVGKVREDMAVELLSLPGLVSLREVSGVAVPALQQAARRRGTLPWTTLSSIPNWGADEPAGGWDLLATLAPRLPRLTRLELAGSGMMSFQFEDFEALLESKLAERLHHLELHCEDDSLDAVLDLAIERGLQHLVAHSDLGGEWVWHGATKTLTVPEGVEVSRSGITVVRGPA